MTAGGAAPRASVGKQPVGPNGSAATGLGFYETGATPLFACQADQRFSYCLYVPQSYRPEGAPLELAVLVHGTGRNPFAYPYRTARIWRRRNGTAAAANGSKSCAAPATSRCETAIPCAW